MGKALNPLLTSNTDGYGPVGSDTGADTLAHYRDWRKRRRKRSTFLPRLFRGWELRDEGWDELDERRLQAELEAGHYQRLVGDDVVIAFAFAQLIVDGDLIPADRARALVAIERQGLPSVMAFRDWSEPSVRLRALALMRQALVAAPDAEPDAAADPAT